MFKENTLKNLKNLEACPFENDEKLEQLRFLYNGLKVHVGLTQEKAWGIDLKEHIELVEKELLKQPFNV
jgi:3-deoxy-manno-octulosonate cytidylyltransferase (CMP-KDO synthetase)